MVLPYSSRLPRRRWLPPSRKDPTPVISRRVRSQDDGHHQRVRQLPETRGRVQGETLQLAQVRDQPQQVRADPQVQGVQWPVRPCLVVEVVRRIVRVLCTGRGNF